VNELMYHINPSLRTRTAVTETELNWLLERVDQMQGEIKDILRTAPGQKVPRFVIPQGCTAAAYSHIIRNKCKALVRLAYRHKAQGNNVDDLVFDFVNLYSGYFFSLAIKLNKDNHVEEAEFKSRVYK